MSARLTFQASRRKESDVRSYGSLSPVKQLAAGPWNPAAVDEGSFLGFLAVDGVLSRETSVFGRSAVELLGPGDILRPMEGTDWASLPYAPSWRVHSASRIAILDAEFEAALRQLPSVAGQLVGRAVQRARTLAILLAIGGTRGISARLLLLFWHLADRWGTRGTEGVVMAIPLPHKLIADLAGTARPTVSKHLKDLEKRELIQRREDRLWVLKGDPPRSIKEVRDLLGFD